MLFFGGFGSVLPYFIYLSLMWICVLIGIRGQIKSILGISPLQETKIENVSLIIKQERVADFSFVKIKKQRPAAVIQMGLFLSFDFTDIIDNNFHSFSYPGNQIYAYIIDASGLRAPPQIISI
jgi:hypothetical protein